MSLKVLTGILLLTSFVGLSKDPFATGEDPPHTPTASATDYRPEFSWDNIERWYPVPDSVAKDRSVVGKVFQAIEAQGAWVDRITGQNIHQLPLGVKRTRNNIEYAIGILSVKFLPDHAILTIFARIKLPQTNKNGYPVELFLGADDIKFTYEGNIVEDSKLMLLGDVPIPFAGGQWMLMLKGGFDYTKKDVTSKTYVTLSCDGVKELGIQGAVEFSRKLILPVEKNGKVNLNRTHRDSVYQTEKGTKTVRVPHRVRGDFNVVGSGFNDLLVGISLQPFVLAKAGNPGGYRDAFKFYVNKAVLDFSDLRNDPAVKFPAYYHERGLLLPNTLAWRGVYINTVEVRLPEQFKKKNRIEQRERQVSFGAHHLIVDNYGVSGTFYADSLISIDKGITNEKGGWPYSLDHISISLAANKFQSVNFNGRIRLPMGKCGENDIGFAYDGIISEKEYGIRVSNDSTIRFDLWKARATIEPNSSIELKVRNGEFRPKAVLHGSIQVIASLGSSGLQSKSKYKRGKRKKRGLKKRDHTKWQDQTESANEKGVKFEGIKFNDLVLQTEAPLISIGKMGYEGDVFAVAKFPVSISDIGVDFTDNNANLWFTLGINLMGTSAGFGSKTKLTIKGYLEKENRPRWRFRGIDLDALELEADLGGIKIAGSVLFLRDHPEYGNGFAGQLSLSFEKGVPGLKVTAQGIFGKTDFRYWQLEALVDFPKPGIVVGAMTMTGFGGGASYRMKRAGFNSSFSPTGVGYVPDKDYGLSLKAMVLFETASSKVGAGFEIIFNNKGGLNSLGFYGQAAIMSSIIPGMPGVGDILNKVKGDLKLKNKFLDKAKENMKFKSKFLDKAKDKLLDKARDEFPELPTDNIPITAKVGISYDFQNEVLHGRMDVYVNVKEGTIRGIGERGKAGWAVLHFDKDKWYFYLGTPKDPLGLKMLIGPIEVKSTAYFMTGSVLPDPPPPPRIVADILGVSLNELDKMREKGVLAKGGGFAFGTNVSIETNLHFLIFYASFQAGAGFDIMLREYPGTRCANTKKPIGINGWYAAGQAYVYLQGELGIHIKLLFIDKKIPIIKGDLATLLQAKGPNPVWMRGYVGGSYYLLGGLVRGKFKFKLTIGEECIMEQYAPLGGIKLIAALTPDNTKKDVDVFSTPQVAFNVAIGKPLVHRIEGDDTKTYRIDLEKFVVLHKGKEIAGKIEWSRDKDRANFIPSDILPSLAKITVRAEVSFKEKIKGIFRQVEVDGKKAREIEENTFTTNKAPNYIPLRNIVYAYPVIDQQYFLEGEHSKGYIQLQQGQDYLFDDTVWESMLAFVDATGKKSESVDFHYHTAENKITYDLPDVSQSTQYALHVVSRLKNRERASGEFSPGLTIKKTIMEKDSAGYTAEIQSNRAETLSLEDGEIERLSYSFATSAYTTFAEKITTIRTVNYGFINRFSDVTMLSNSIEDHELFDIVELLGSPSTKNKPLVHIAATLEDNYYRQDIAPYLYQSYPVERKYYFKNNRDSSWGIPPRRALPINSLYITDLEYGRDIETFRMAFPFRYDLGYAYKSDWVDILSQILGDWSNNNLPLDSRANHFLDEKYRSMRFGFYDVRMSYRLPGGIKGSQAVYRFKK